MKNSYILILSNTISDFRKSNTLIPFTNINKIIKMIAQKERKIEGKRNTHSDCVVFFPVDFIYFEWLVVIFLLRTSTKNCQI